MRRVVGLIATAALIVFGLMFSVLLLAFIVTAGLLVWGFLWWKTRALRKQIREQMSNQAMGGMVNEAGVFKGEIIEGEVIRKVVSIEEIKR
jgi:hypothetical protein